MEFILYAGIVICIQILIIIIYKHALRSKAFGKFTDIKLVLILCFTVFALYVGSAIITGYYLDKKLNSFDLNGDGFFSGEEITPEQISTMQAWTNDLGRNLAPFVAGTFFVINFIVLIVFTKITDALVFRKNTKRKK